GQAVRRDQAAQRRPRRSGRKRAEPLAGHPGLIPTRGRRPVFLGRRRRRPRAAPQADQVMLASLFPKPPASCRGSFGWLLHTPAAVFSLAPRLVPGLVRLVATQPAAGATIRTIPGTRPGACSLRSVMSQPAERSPAQGRGLVVC